MMFLMTSKKMGSTERSLGRVLIGFTLKIVVVATIFVGGFLAGGLSTARYIENKSRQYLHQTEVLSADLTTLVGYKLDLTDEQAERVERVFHERIVQFQDWRDTVIAMTNDFLDKVDGDIRPILDEDQTSQWETFFGGLRQRWVPEDKGNYRLPFKLPGFSSSD